MQLLELVKNNPMLQGAIFAPMDNVTLIIYLKENNNFILIRRIQGVPNYEVSSSLCKISFICWNENIEEYLIKLLSYCSNDYEN